MVKILIGAVLGPVGRNILPAFIDFFPVNQANPILFVKLFRLFDSFIAQRRREMRG
jgi:hypothetical protein